MPFLKNLNYTNFLLFDSLDFKPHSGLNILTGESGTGKSLFLQGLHLLFGDRLDNKLASALKNKAILEAEFEVEENDLLIRFFQQEDLDFSDSVLVRREIMPNGKNRCFINDTPVSQQVLKELSVYLAEIHSQHDTFFIKENKFQVGLLDAFAKSTILIEEYQQLYVKQKSLIKKLKELQIQKNELNKEQDYRTYLLDELRSANIQDTEEEVQLEAEQQILANASDIIQESEGLTHLLESEEMGIEMLANKAKINLKNLSTLSSDYAVYLQQFESAWIELKEILKDVTRKSENVSIDPERLEEVNQRLETFQQLKRKHQVLSLAELKGILSALEKELHSSEDLEKTIQDIELEINATEVLLTNAAEKLKSKRMEEGPNLEDKIVQMLSELEIPHAKFSVVFEDLKREDWNTIGSQNISFMFSANPGIIPQLLQNVASGGELSRLMLCFKSILAKNNQKVMLVFDEIDTGVSGEVAKKMGKMIADMGTDSQLIVITHLPQVASKGSSHFLMRKNNTQEEYVSEICALSKIERQKEIARLLSGKVPGEKAMLNAIELLEENI
jgi:DNA repair protein RecN (Recombination protein N)